MYLKRAIWLSVLAYVSSFIVATGAALLLGIDLAVEQEIPPALWYAGAGASVVFSVVFAYWYFHSPKTTPNVKEGFRFGLIMIATGFVLDFITLLPLWAHENPLELILPYYLAPMFWVSLALVLAATTLTGKFLEKKSAEKIYGGQ